MVALAIFGHKHLSVTDKACKWNKPKKPADDIPLTAEMCFGASTSKVTYQALNIDDINGDSVETFKESLKACGPTGLGWLLSPEPTIKLGSLIPNIEDIIFSKEYVESDNKQQYLTEKLAITEERIKEIERETVGQSSNSMWLIVRKNRLTSSNFGRILKSCLRSRFPASLFQTLTGN